MRFRGIERLTSAFPTQFRGWTDDGRPFFVRYRHGVLSLEVGRPGDPADVVPGGGYDVYEEYVDTETGGEISWPEAERALAQVDLDAALSAMEALGALREAAGKPLPGRATHLRLEGISVTSLHLHEAPWPEGTSDPEAAYAVLGQVANRVTPGLLVITYPAGAGWTAHLLARGTDVNAIDLGWRVSSRLGSTLLSCGDGGAVFAVPDPSTLLPAIRAVLARLTRRSAPPHRHR